ncbi:MAG: phospholipase D family protein [Methylotenera sp.]|uniref:phospholipase D family protein n=1 Tax=Methylotenera sp. TaxID=2051956 RepID=UPI00184C76B6|nr:phospholipase D family protein [Methylotenera sp.]NOU25681.1 phospholipase D family protein [Methylotenera sp.]
MTRQISKLSLFFVFLIWFANSAIASQELAFIDSQITSHPNQSGIYVLDKGEEALLARAWLVDNAQKTIEVQYFIWSTDNIGILASEALLRAADRGVKVRVIVDDLLIDAPDKSLLALAKHPNIDIHIYNPQHSVGTPFHKRLLNIAVNFRGVNQRMHDKTFIVDGKLAITGGRNMAAEYFDYNNAYNFRDRDALLLGDVAKSMQTSFEKFWSSPLSAPVEELYDGLGLMQKHVKVKDDEIQNIYHELHNYAKNPENFSAENLNAIQNIPTAFMRLAEQITWTDVEFISDTPGKNKMKYLLGGGGASTLKLAQLVESANEQIVIQSPYLVMSNQAQNLFKSAIKRGVKVRINTNSLASTDNIQAFSGYRNQRDQLIKMGIEIFEYKPDPQIKQQLVRQAVLQNIRPPVFAIHAKTMVVDNKSVYIGTFNFDPRSQNLNTEVGVIVQNENLAKNVQQAIEIDMRPENSWNAATDKPDQYASAMKRKRVVFYQLTPIKPLL